MNLAKIVANTLAYALDAGWEHATLHITRYAGRDTKILAILPDTPHATPLYSRLVDAAARARAAAIRGIRVDPLDPPRAIYAILEALREEREVSTVYVNASPALTAVTIIATLLAATGLDTTPAILAATHDPAKPLALIPTKPLRAAIEGLPRGLERIAKLVYLKARRLDELAQETGLSETTLRKRLSRLSSLGFVARRSTLYTPTPWLAVYASLRGWRP